MTDRAEELVVVVLLLMVEVVVVPMEVEAGGMRGIPRPTTLRWGKCSCHRWHSRSCTKNDSFGNFEGYTTIEGYITCLD